MISRPFFLSALFVLFLSLTFSSAHAQLRASIRGLITAQQGAPSSERHHQPDESPDGAFTLSMLELRAISQ